MRRKSNSLALPLSASLKPLTVHRLHTGADRQVSQYWHRTGNICLLFLPPLVSCFAAAPARLQDTANGPGTADAGLLVDVSSVPMTASWCPMDSAPYA